MADICSILTWLAASLASEHRHHVSRPMVFGRVRHWLPCKPPQPQRQLAVAGREAAKSDAGYPLSKLASTRSIWPGFLVLPVFWYTKIRAACEVISVHACVYTCKLAIAGCFPYWTVHASFMATKLKLTDLLQNCC